MDELSVTLWEIKSDLGESQVGIGPSCPSELTVWSGERRAGDYAAAGSEAPPLTRDQQTERKEENEGSAVDRHTFTISSGGTALEFVHSALVVDAASLFPM